MPAYVTATVATADAGTVVEGGGGIALGSTAATESVPDGAAATIPPASIETSGTNQFPPTIAVSAATVAPEAAGVHVTTDAVVTDAAVSTPAPTVSGGATLTAVVTDAAAATAAPSISGTATIEAVVADAVGAAPAPTEVRGAGQGEQLATVATATAGTHVPLIAGAATIEAVVTDAAKAETLAPTFSFGGGVQPEEPKTALAETLAPAVSGAANIDAVATGASVETPQPVVQGVANSQVLATVIRATVATPAPTITSVIMYATAAILVPGDLRRAALIHSGYSATLTPSGYRCAFHAEKRKF